MARDRIWERQYKMSTAASTTAEPLFEIPKGWAVIGAYARVDVARAGGSSSGVTLGDTDVDGFFTETELASTATGMKTGNGAYLATACGKLYNAKTVINAIHTYATIPTTLAVIKFKLVMRKIY